MYFESRSGRTLAEGDMHGVWSADVPFESFDDAFALQLRALALIRRELGLSPDPARTSQRTRRRMLTTGVPAFEDNGGSGAGLKPLDPSQDGWDKDSMVFYPDEVGISPLIHLVSWLNFEYIPPDGWWSGGWWAEDDLTSIDVIIIDTAIGLIRREIDLVEGYFDEPGVTRHGGCVTGKFSLEGLDQDDLHVRVASWIPGNAFTIPGPTNEITLDRVFLDAINNELRMARTLAHAWCTIASLAGTIVHEVSHLCLNGERESHLLGHYVRYMFAHRYGYTGDQCCRRDPIPPGTSTISWDPQDWKNSAEVIDVVHPPGPEEDVFGTILLSDCD